MLRRHLSHLARHTLALALVTTWAAAINYGDMGKSVSSTGHKVTLDAIVLTPQ